MTMHVPQDPSLIEVPVINLTPGMYVAELDKPWLETPFATQGFVVNNHDDIEYIAKHCSHVYVDTRRTVRVSGLNEKRFKPRSGHPGKPPGVGIKQEFSRAKVDFESASVAMEQVFARIQSNRRVNVGAVKQAITPLIDSVLRNNEAMAALARLKLKGDYLFQHSLSTAVWAAVLGRNLGLEKSELMDLALGVSLMDVGMCQLPTELLEKAGKLDEADLTEIRNHVKYGVKLLDGSEELSRSTLNILVCHHERHDGSGYPQGLKGNAIPMFARIAGLVDSYDAMTTERPHAPARTSYEAVQELADLKDSQFQASLIEHFVQTIGMFPTGSIVELNTGEVGVVVAQNPARRLRPKIVLVLDADKRKLARMTVIDLNKYAESKDSVSTHWIVRELRAEAYGISPDDYFI